MTTDTNSGASQDSPTERYQIERYLQFQEDSVRRVVIVEKVRRGYDEFADAKTESKADSQGNQVSEYLIQTIYLKN